MHYQRYRNESINVSISKLIIGTKPKRFDLVRSLSEQKQNVSICSKIIKNQIGTFWRFFKVQKWNQNETELISYRIETFPYTYASEETKRNFCELIPNFFTSSDFGTFLFASSSSGIKRELLHFQKMISKRKQNVTNWPGFSEDKTKLFVVPKKIWKQTRTKLLDQISLVLIENVFFDPEFCFKNEYIRSFLEQKQQNESFRSWKNVGLTLLLPSWTLYWKNTLYPLSCCLFHFLP